MTQTHIHFQFIDRLPHVRGRLVENAPLSRLSWFRTGGTADALFEPADEKDLITFLRHVPSDIPITVIGGGSNLLVRDGGVEGVVIRLGRAFSEITVSGDMVKAGAGAMDAHVAKAAAKAGLTGLEFLVGIPGTIGGALKMNAGAYGTEIKDVLLHAHAVDRYGHVTELENEDFHYGYRSCKIQKGLILLSGFLRGHTDKHGKAEERMAEIMSERQVTQPIGTRTGGSTFKNPEGMKAWELVEKAGCRGLRIGDAQISEKHCNFMINHGEATAADIESLGEKVRKRVKNATGVELEWEIQIIGMPLDGGPA